MMGNATHQTNMDLVAGFYWARRRDGGALTVIEVREPSLGELWVQMIGNLNVMDTPEASEHFEILDRIPEPASNEGSQEIYSKQYNIRAE